MSKKIAAILVLTVVSFHVLCICSFGVIITKKVETETKTASLEPVSSQSFYIGNKGIQFDTYLNKEIAGHHYSIKIPHGWRIKVGKRAGSYIINFAGGSASVMVMELSGSSTLEDYIIMQEEPGLRNKLDGYNRVSYEKAIKAYRLIYVFSSNDKDYWAARTYYEGEGRFCLVTLTSLQSDLNDRKALFDAVINCFRWESE